MMSAAKHILIVEDEALIALDMEVTLADLGHRVTSASSIAQARNILNSDPVDVAVLDYHLKDGTADHLARELQQREVPFVICSGTAGLAELATVFQDTKFLPKPFSADDLIGAITAAHSGLL